MSRSTPLKGDKAPLRGVLLILGAATLWSLNGALIKLTFDSGEGPAGVTIAFYRSFFAGLFLLPLARGRRTRHKARGKRQRTTLWLRKRSPIGSCTAPAVIKGEGNVAIASNSPLRAQRSAVIWCVVFFTLMTLCFVIANVMTQAANAIILQYTSTFWIFALSSRWLGEKPHMKDLWILALAMTGIGIIFAGKASTDPWGLVIALAAGLFYGLLTLMIRRLREADAASLMAINCLGSALLLFPLVLSFGQILVSARSLVLLVMMGVVQYGLPYYLYSLGLRSVPAYQAGVLTLLEPVLVPIWAYLVVSEAVPPATMTGGALILIALLLFFRASRKCQTAIAVNIIG